MEDYKKMYEDLLERIEQMANAQPEVTKAAIESLFHELKESEDKKIRKALLNYIYDVHDDDEERARWISWLKKQGEQKPTDKNEPKFKVGDWICHNVYKKPLQIVEDLGGGDYRVEPKSIINAKELKEGIFRYWTIQDAKDGDVLAAHECLVLFKEIDGLNIRCYCTYHYLNHQKFYVDILQDKTGFCPATKEQRDTLEKAITNAGYRWDAEHKQLNKIEQKSATMSLDEAIKHCKEKSCGNNACALEHKQLEKWLTELKKLKEQKPADIIPQDFEKYVEHLLSLSDGEGHGSPAKVKEVSAELFRLAKLEQKPKWSEEDENKRKKIIHLMEAQNYFDGAKNEFITPYKEECDWLKSLKPQNRWQSSDREIGAILAAIGDEREKGSDVVKELQNIYQQLKKLSEE